ncbi:MAG: hypothetical protein Q9227_006959 [Pyrenula ochraceoflavens]
MKRQIAPMSRLTEWANFYGAKFHNAQIQQTQDKGGALVALRAVPEDADVLYRVLLTVPQELVLSLAFVQEQAKYDKHLRDILDALREFGKTARGAILSFLLLQMTRSSPEASDAVGVSNPLTEYVKFLPEAIPLPIFWNEDELFLLNGTSLKPAVEQKLASLRREFDLLKAGTGDIPWCKEVWWSGGDVNDEGGCFLNFDDWKMVDAMYRSRALEIPGIGHAMVPCVDMANHASGERTVALYEAEGDIGAALVLRNGKSLQEGEEITITYGDDKGACEMLFSYGFLENNVKEARALFLDLDIPDDDPLKQAKQFVADEAPGVKLFTEGAQIAWESPYVQWICINEEDGLNFQVLQSTDGKQELKVLWKDIEIQPPNLGETLKEDPMWAILQLRAVVTIQSRVKQQKEALTGNTEFYMHVQESKSVRKEIWRMIGKLRDLEEAFLEKADASLEEEKMQLLDSPIVQKYLSQAPGSDAEEPEIEEDDFS